jgi:protein-tyrosine-phosphatase
MKISTDQCPISSKERSMSTILIVCTGNLCRSPMAEGLLRERLAQDETQARRDWRVASAGVWTTDGRPASAHAVEEMERRGIDISGHRSRNVTHEMLAQADLVLVMSRQHAEALGAAFPEYSSKVYLLSEMSGPAYDIQDPYGGSRAEYAYTARELARLVEDGYDRITALVEKTLAE